ncbi:hypothetical protein AB5V95_01855 [Metamycoplasma spumans]|uniref:hypothetical protein n=1 Tax=Metamycoplasma spumans TaxID=92406 RepID=UPI0034DCEA32
MTKIYYLMYKDKKCLSFEYDKKSKTLSKIIELEGFDFLKQKNEEDLKNFLFLDDFLATSRPNYENLLKNFDSKLEVIEKYHKLNLNNCFWIKELNENITFDEINLFDHFENELTDYSMSKKLVYKNTELKQSPDWFTEGQMIKSWVKENDDIYLIKAPNYLASKLSFENYAEYFASQLVNVLTFNFVSYDLVMYKKKLVSKSKLFSSKKINYISFSKLISKNDLLQEEIEEFLYAYYGKENYEDLMVIDTLILNADRHLGNFGMLFDSESEKFIGTAPLFDFNKSLLYDFPLYNEKTLKKEIDEYTKRPTTFYNSFDEQLEKFAKPRHKQWVEKLKKFKFKEHDNFKVNKNYLKAITLLVKKQIKKLEKIINHS